MSIRQGLPRTTARGQHHVISYLKPLTPLFLTLLLLGGSVRAAAAYTGQGPEPVYSVDQIRADLREQPTAWVGRTVRVHGILEGAFVYCDPTHPCPPVVFGMIDAANMDAPQGHLLRMTLASPSPLWATLRRLPLIDAFAPPLQMVRFGLPTTYRLQLRAAPAFCRRTNGVMCYQGVLVDAVWPTS